MSSTISNSTDKLPNHVHIFSVEDHEYWKPKLLESIDNVKKNYNLKPNGAGYYYDFDMQDVDRLYEPIFKNAAYDYFEELGDIYGLKIEKFGKPWFHQYKKGSGFGWHQHDFHWAWVYFLELPNKKESTEFLTYGQFDVKEGDLLFFPSFLVHRGPEIESEGRKTILSSNVKYIVDREKIKHYGEQHFRN